MRTRTNLHLDQDALQVASTYAQAKGISLGLAVSELIMKADKAPTPPVSASSKLKTDAYGVLVVRAELPTLTPSMVKAALENSLDD